MPAARRPRLLAVLALVLALAAFPLGVGASHDFADVPDSNVFHADISALAASGVTTGCGGGNYCPSAFVTREQMAAFMNRLGALAVGKVPVVNADRLDGLDSGQFLRGDVGVTGHFACHARTMHPLDSGDLTYGGGLRYRSSGAGYFECPLVLPDGALITAFTGAMKDQSGTYYARCDLVREETLTLGAPQVVLATTGDTGVAFMDGAIILTDPSVTDAVVDNSQYSYVSQCYVSGGGLFVGVRGTLVEFTVSGYPVT